MLHHLCDAAPLCIMKCLWLAMCLFYLDSISFFILPCSFGINSKEQYIKGAEQGTCVNLSDSHMYLTAASTLTSIGGCESTLWAERKNGELYKENCHKNDTGFKNTVSWREPCFSCEKLSVMYLKGAYADVCSLLFGFWRYRGGTISLTVWHALLRAKVDRPT